MVLLDTTFIIDLMKEIPEALEKAKKLEKRSEEIRIPTPVLFELWEGIERADRSLEEEEEVLAVLESFLNLPLNPEHAKVAGRRSGELIEEGEMLDPIDVLIGGTAAAENEPLVTRNGDFERISEVEVEGY